MRFRLLCGAFVVSPALAGYNGAFIVSHPRRTSSLTAVGANTPEGEESVDFLTSREASEAMLTSMTPRAARVETPLKALFASGLLLSPSTPAKAVGSAKNFQTVMYKYFPQALSTSAMSTKVRAALADRQFTRANTLFGTCVSPDEINNKPEESLSSVLGEYLGKNSGVYSMGGLGGLPLLGKSGMVDFLSHSPNKGKVVLLFGPNVGISDTGIVGKVERLGQNRLSECCEPGLNTYNKLQAQIRADEEQKAASPKVGRFRTEAGTAAEVETAKRKQYHRLRRGNAPPPEPGVEIPAPAPAVMRARVPPPKRRSVLDNQYDFILENLREYVDTPEASSVSKPAVPAFMSFQMFNLGYDMIMEQLEACFREQAARENIDEVVLLGGIIISRGQVLGSIEPREDYFQPLVFESYNGELDEYGLLEPLDLFESTFGERPAFLDV